MRFLLTKLMLVTLLTPTISQNIFLSRDFWSSKTTIEEIQKKINEGNDLLEMGPGGFDGILNAILADCNYETLKFLIEQPNVDVNVETHHSNNYLMWAAYKGNLPIMKLLLDKGSKTNIINSHGQSLLMHAAMSGLADPDLYDFCLKNGGDIKNDRDEAGRTVMLVAISRLKDISFLKYFTDRGLSLHDTDNNGNGLFNYAVQGGNLDNLKKIVSMGVKYPDNNKGENAFSFVGRGRMPNFSIELLEYLKSLNIKPNKPFVNGQNLAHTFARLGILGEYTSFLDQNDVDKGKLDNDGNSPLMLAAYRGTAETIKYWLNHNDVNHKNNNGQSAIHNAISMNTPEIVDLLLKSGADVRIKDKEGKNLYHTLIANYRTSKGSLVRVTQIIDLLTAAGLPLDKDGQILHTALQKNDQALMSLLLNLGQDINAKDKDGYTLLHYAAMRGKDLSMIKFLIQNGANVDVKTELGESIDDLMAENESLKSKNLTIRNINIDK